MFRLTLQICAFVFVTLLAANLWARPACDTTSAQKSSLATRVAVCVNTCQKISRAESAKATDLFIRNCKQFYARKPFMDNLGAELGDIAINYAKLPYRMVKAIVSIPGDLASLGSSAYHYIVDEPDKTIEICEAQFANWLEANGIAKDNVSARWNSLRKFSESDAKCAPVVQGPLLSEVSGDISFKDCIEKSAVPVRCLSVVHVAAAGIACFGDKYSEHLKSVYQDSAGAVTSSHLPIGLGYRAAQAVENSAEVARAEAASLSEEALRNVDVADNVQTVSIKAPEFSANADSFATAYKAKIYSSPEQNQSFISAFEDSAKLSQEGNVRIFDVENSSMKPLNDLTRDKNLVTALTNFHKESLLEALPGLKAEFPDLKFETYSDFKSIKIAVKSSKPLTPDMEKRLQAALNKAYKAANQKLADKLAAEGLDMSAYGKTEDWFKAGYGKTVDEASLAARRARQVKSDSGALNYASNEVSVHMTGQLQKVEDLRQGLAQKSFAKTLFEGPASSRIPKLEVFEIARKSQSDEQFLKSLKTQFPNLSISPEEAKNLFGYIRSVDDFSPTLLIGKRENVSLDTATQGGISADFLKMGANNSKATAKALAGQADLGSALLATRAGEREVTKMFRNKMEKFKRIVGGEVVCSGDDCVRALEKPLSPDDKLKLIKDVARNPDTRGVRMAFVGPNVAPEIRMKLAAHGESIEKVLRKELTGKIPSEKLKNLTFGLDMETTQLNTGQVNLLIGNSLLTNLSPTEVQIITGAFGRAVNASNVEAASYAAGSTRLMNDRLILKTGTIVSGTAAILVPSQNDAGAP